MMTVSAQFILTVLPMHRRELMSCSYPPLTPEEEDTRERLQTFVASYETDMAALEVAQNASVADLSGVIDAFRFKVDDDEDDDVDEVVAIGGDDGGEDDEAAAGESRSRSGSKANDKGGHMRERRISSDDALHGVRRSSIPVQHDELEFYWEE